MSEEGTVSPSLIINAEPAKRYTDITHLWRRPAFLNTVIDSKVVLQSTDSPEGDTK